MYYYDYLFLFLCFLFIHSSLDGLLGCFHLLAIGHNASVNTSTQICLGLSAFNSFGYNPEGELPDHFVILFLIFWGSTVLFSIGLDRLTFSPSVHRGSNSFASSPTPVIFCLFFFFSFHNGCERKSASESCLVPCQGLLPREPWSLSHTDLSPGKSQLCSNSDPTTWESLVETWGSFDFSVSNGSSLNKHVWRV